MRHITSSKRVQSKQKWPEAKSPDWRDLSTKFSFFSLKTRINEKIVLRELIVE